MREMKGESCSEKLREGKSGAHYSAGPSDVSGRLAVERG